MHQLKFNYIMHPFALSIKVSLFIKKASIRWLINIFPDLYYTSISILQVETAASEYRAIIPGFTAKDVVLPFTTDGGTSTIHFTTGKIFLFVQILVLPSFLSDLICPLTLSIALHFGQRLFLPNLVPRAFMSNMTPVWHCLNPALHFTLVRGSSYQIW